MNECNNCGIEDSLLADGYCEACHCRKCGKNAGQTGCSMNSVGYCNACELALNPEGQSEADTARQAISDTLDDLDDQVVLAMYRVIEEFGIPKKECKGKAAARSLAILVLDMEINSFIRKNNPDALIQAYRSLEPFGYPDLNVLREKLSIP